MHRNKSLNISFVVCALDYKSSLEKVLSGILDIKEKKDELILVINQKENTGFPINFLDHFDHVLLNPIRGISLSRNLATETSCHNYIAFLDDDTVLPLGWRENLDYLLKYNSIALVQTQSPSINSSIFHSNLVQNRYVMFDVAGSIIRKSALEEVAGFDKSFVRSEDMDLGTKLYFSGWDLAFSDLATSDLSSKTKLIKLRDLLVSSKFEARIIKKSQIRLDSNYLRLLWSIILDKKNKLGFKRFRFLHTYLYLIFNKYDSEYELLPRKMDCLIIAGSDVYRLLPESRVSFGENYLVICSLKKRNFFKRFELSTLKFNINSGKYYIEVPRDDFLADGDLYRKV